jgi:hypothetical protein
MISILKRRVVGAEESELPGINNMADMELSTLAHWSAIKLQFSIFNLRKHK